MEGGADAGARGVEGSIGSVRVEAQDDFTKLEPVAIRKPAQAVPRGKLLVVDDHRVGLGQVHHDPLPILKGESGVLAADGARPQANVLRGIARVAPEDQLGRPAGDSNEANLMVMWITRNHFEVSGEELHGLVDGPPKSHRLGGCGFIVGLEVANDFQRGVHRLAQRRIRRHGRERRRRRAGHDWRERRER